MVNTSPANLVDVVNSTKQRDISKPVEHVVSELKQFHSAFETLNDRFTAKGIPEAFLDVAIPLSELLSQSEADWVNGRFATPEQRKKWKELSPKGEVVRDDLFSDLSITLIDNKESQSILKTIARGEGHADTLQDIPELITLARSNPAESALAGITEERLLEAEAIAKECADSFAATKTIPAGASVLKVNRDKAKTFASEYLSRVRFYVKHIFKNEPELRALFFSAYRQEM